MKLLDKLKNALFEEEYVEVEEKPKKKATKKEEKKSSVMKERLEKPIAKKIVQPEKMDVDEELAEKPLPEETIDSYEQSQTNDFKFPMMDDKDFEIEELVMEPPHESIKSVEEEPIKPEKITPKEKKSKPYGLDDFELPEPTHGLYERKDEKTYFKPSPIISPIYGILDKNYKKDDIKEKKEIRLSSSYTHDNLDFETVRKKAYGTLADDIKNEFGTESEQVSTAEDDYKEDDQSQLVDLSTEHDTPEIKEITVADAEEYFEDLGLEYNVDYKDISKEAATGRRTSKKKEDTEENPKVEEVKEESIEVKSVADDNYIPNHTTANETEINDANDKDIDDDNLFDLIDSMYDND